jgi:hypothetical protein
MAADLDRAEARILDHCTSFGRWLDDPGARTSADGRLGAAIDDHTLHMLRIGLASHPAHLRDALRN